MEWTIGELAEQATALLGPTAQLSGRVRDVPNERLIRWYATIGLLDPPLTRRGRVALYGRRHLLQLVAVKRRQAEGRTIAEIQAELAGATDRTLEAISSGPCGGQPGVEEPQRLDGLDLHLEPQLALTQPQP
ncbi:MerR family transcriptional regulator, partial [Streptosporangium sandarakinum]|uniref:MerR family transcriptional regulator n=1 Tax=Streptosporangium sandarakinum TaxID=1260955 RepID=UPI0033B83A96